MMQQARLEGNVGRRARGWFVLLPRRLRRLHHCAAPPVSGPASGISCWCRPVPVKLKPSHRVPAAVFAAHCGGPAGDCALRRRPLGRLPWRAPARSGLQLHGCEMRRGRSGWGVTADCCRPGGEGVGLRVSWREARGRGKQRPAHASATNSDVAATIVRVAPSLWQPATASTSHCPWPCLHMQFKCTLWHFACPLPPSCSPLPVQSAAALLPEAAAARAHRQGNVGALLLGALALAPLSGPSRWEASSYTIASWGACAAREGELSTCLLIRCMPM